MHEDLEQKMAEIAELVADLSPEEYSRLGPSLREFGLALAETLQAWRESERVREVLERAREDYDRVLEHQSSSRN
jgi:hypothetical protein